MISLYVIGKVLQVLVWVVGGYFILKETEKWKSKNKAQAKEFVANVLFEMLEKCRKQNLNQDFYGELAFFTLGSLIFESSGEKAFKDLVFQIRKNKKPKRARRKSWKRPLF